MKVNSTPKRGIVEQTRAAKTLTERKALLAKAKTYQRIHPGTLRKVERLVKELC